MSDLLTNGYCHAGKATLLAHERRLAALEDCVKEVRNEVRSRFDRQQWLLVATLAGVITTLVLKAW